MKATQMLHDLGQSLWLDNITRDLLTSGTLTPLHRRVLGDGAHLEPDDLRPRHQEQHRLRRRHPQETGGRQVGRGAVLRAGAGGPHPGRRSVSTRSTTRPTAWTAGCRWKSRPCWPTTRPAPSPRPRNLHARAGRPNLFIKIPGTKEGLPAIEEAIFAGVPINVTLLVLPRALRGGRRGVPARHRAAHRRRAEARCRLRGFGVRQPLGCRGRRARCRTRSPTSSASPSASAPTRRTATCLARRAGSVSTTPAPARSASSGPAREPRIPRPPTSCTSKRSPHPSP